MTIYGRPMRLLVSALVVLAIGAPRAKAVPLPSGISHGQVEDRTYLSYTTEVLDNLMTYGTDHYGGTTSDLFVSILDVTTKETVVPEFGDTDWRADTRFDRRSPQAANFLHDQPLLRTMYRVSDVTGDSNYSNFADTNINYATTNLIDSNGMFWWGWHRRYDVVDDAMEFESNGGDMHEMHYVTVPEWERMWALNPTAVQTEIEQIWERHIKVESTGEIDRHDTQVTETFSFIFSSASFIEATSFLSTKIGGAIPGESDTTIDTWIERAKRLAAYPLSKRDPTTGLVAHTPNRTGIWARLDGERTYTSTHLLAQGLLKAYEHTGDTEFRDQALDYLTDWAMYAYDPTSGSFYGSLELDGTPVLGPRIDNEPRGLVDIWQPNAIDTEFPLEAAQAYADAFALTGDAGLRTTADRWAALIRNTMADKETLAEGLYVEYAEDWAPLGTYAEHYGRSIDFFLTMFDAAGKDHYLLAARDLAKDAVSSLYYDGFFRGHPNKPYYEALDGVPLLLEALVELDQHDANFTKFGDFDNDGDVDDDDFNNFLRPNMNTTVSAYVGGDVDGNGQVTLLDFDRFKNEYYEGTSVLSLSVPEPNTFALLLAATPAWLLLRSSARSLRRSIGIQ